MRNAIISILLFIVVMLFVNFANNQLVEMCEIIVDETQNIEFLILKDEWEDAFISSVELMDTIKENDLITSIYLNHQDTDHLTDEALRLNIYSECKNKDESLASVHHLKYSAANIKELHQLKLKNIF